MVQWTGIQGIISYGNCWYRSFHHNDFTSEYGNRFILTLNLSFLKPLCTLEYRKVQQVFPKSMDVSFPELLLQLGESKWCPGGAAPMQPHPHCAQSHPSPRHTHIFRKIQEPTGATLRGKKQHRASVGSDSCPRSRNPLDLPSGSDRSTIREDKYWTEYEICNKWVYLKQARQTLGSFSAESPAFPPHSSAAEEDSCRHTDADHSHHMAHLSQSHTS